MRSSIVAVLLIAFAGACASESAEGWDPALLAKYRAALPSRDALTATTPSTVTRDVGDPALYPQASWQLVSGVNGAVAGIVDTLEAVTSYPPTFYNSETREFLWGPWDFEGEVGKVAAYIKEQPEDEDFRYAYAILRGVDNDLASFRPIIAGGATPDPENEEHGAGITLWDFDANAAFLAEAFPAEYVAEQVPHGRFIALYSRDQDVSVPANEVAWVLAYLRDFVSEDNPAASPADLDYFYGRAVDNVEGFTVDFLNFEGIFDVSEPADGVDEALDVAMAFVNSGVGRAEATATGGSLGAGGSLTAVECWDESIERLYLHFNGQDGGGAIDYLEPPVGTEALCGPVFSSTLAALALPSLDDIDPALEAAMVAVAEGGMAALAGGE